MLLYFQGKSYGHQKQFLPAKKKAAEEFKIIQCNKLSIVNNHKHLKLTV